MALKLFIIMAKIFGGAVLGVLVALLVIVMIAIVYQLVTGIKEFKNLNDEEDDDEFDE